MNFAVRRSSIFAEFEEISLWDKRCNKSIKRIAYCVYKNQGKSFSAVSGKYLRQNGSRIFSDQRVTVQKMQQGHLKSALSRIKKRAGSSYTSGHNTRRLYRS